MSLVGINEEVVKAALLDWFGSVGYELLHGPDIGPGEPAAERADYAQVALQGRLRSAID